jgi:transcriptional regulator NrdR family protein
MEIKAKKKDGTLEDFNRSKIINGLLKSGATAQEAESLAGQVETWAQTAAVDGVVETGAIRSEVLRLLRTANPGVAANFEAYKKPQ